MTLYILAGIFNKIPIIRFRGNTIRRWRNMSGSFYRHKSCWYGAPEGSRWESELLLRSLAINFELPRNIYNLIYTSPL